MSSIFLGFRAWTPRTSPRRAVRDSGDSDGYPTRMAVARVCPGLAKDGRRVCQRCDLYRNATQTVFGDGARTASLVLVGEQPGDQEDKAGKPFVGPAGRLLDKALAAADIDRESVYLTNAVKHFKFEERGKRRIHKAPNRTEVVACQPWLLAELNAIQPDVVVLLGATAAKSLMGSSFRLTQHRGEVLRLPADATESRLGRGSRRWSPPCIRRRCFVGRRRTGIKRSTRLSPICGLRRN